MKQDNVGTRTNESRPTINILGVAFGRSLAIRENFFQLKKGGKETDSPLQDEAYQVYMSNYMSQLLSAVLQTSS